MVPRQDITRDPRFARGLQLYATGSYFECHEVLEDLWREAPLRDRLFVQALIHLAVAFHHWSSKNREGTLLQLAKCGRKLAGYLPAYCGLPTSELYVAVIDATEKVRSGEDLPSIRIY
jgi:hypothetical protein